MPLVSCVKQDNLIRASSGNRHLLKALVDLVHVEGHRKVVRIGQELQ
jgi:hypothetical protein